jgi:hypothetical protein
VSELLCPHCQERGCDGRCRFKVGRRGFLGLGLGALAASLLPIGGAPAVYHGSELYAAVEADYHYRVLAEQLKKIYAKEYFDNHQRNQAAVWKKNRRFLEGRSWPNEA